jgi:hypothetical protein
MINLSVELDMSLSNLPVSGPQRAHITHWLFTATGDVNRVRDVPQPFRGWLRNPDRLRKINADPDRAARLNRKTERWLRTLDR